MLKTYVISLEYPTQLMESLPQQGLLPVWSPGVNGKALTQKEIEENTTPLCAKICTRPTVGIGMAHVNAWASIIKNHDDYALIVEDDVFFTDNFNMQLTRALQHVPKDFDILYLGCFGCTSDSTLITYILKLLGLINFNDKTTPVNAYITKPSTVAATHAYIISKKGAQKLLTYSNKKVSMHIDTWIQTLITDKKIIAYVTTPRIAFQTSTDTIGSTNTIKSHPILLQKAVNGLYVDDYLSLNYFLSVTVFKLYKFPLSFISGIFLTIGIILAFFRPNLLLITAIFLAISIPDFIYDSDMYSILLHYIVLVLPTLLVIGFLRVRG